MRCKENAGQGEWRRKKGKVLLVAQRPVSSSPHVLPVTALGSDGSRLRPSSFAQPSTRGNTTGSLRNFLSSRRQPSPPSRPRPPPLRRLPAATTTAAVRPMGPRSVRKLRRPSRTRPSSLRTSATWSHLPFSSSLRRSRSVLPRHARRVLSSSIEGSLLGPLRSAALPSSTSAVRSLSSSTARRVPSALSPAALATAGALYRLRGSSGADSRAVRRAQRFPSPHDHLPSSHPQHIPCELHSRRVGTVLTDITD